MTNEMSTGKDMGESRGFSEEQKRCLEETLGGLAQLLPFAGVSADGRITASPLLAPVNLAAPAEAMLHGTPVGDLTKQEKWKLDENPLDIWEKLVAHAEAGRRPDEPDTFRFKYHGLFYVAPAQDSFMVRLRVPAGILTAHQMHGLADLASDLGGGYAHVTTRANIQIRELKPRDIVRVLVRLQELGLTSRGSGADNIRNITASPTSGFDPGELIDVRPFAKGLHHYILNHRDLYGLPRKFNIAFDGGGAVCAAADTNDIGFVACRVTRESLARRGDQPPAEPGIYFRVQLGGITGHKDFARDTGLLARPSEIVAVAAAMVRVFSENGDRTDRKKARLKYLLEKWGAEKFIEETQRRLAFPLARLPVEACEPPRPFAKHGWIGPHRQAQAGLSYVGVGLSLGRMSARQMHQVADFAAEHGSGELRLTVWQNLLIPHVPDASVGTLVRILQKLGFSMDPAAAAGGFVACTGNAGCRYSSTDTKGHAAQLARHLDKRRPGIDVPINVHFTGCPHSCAQHYCGDMGFLGTRLGDGSEGYHVVLGGGMGDEQGIAREVFRGVRAGDVPGLVSRVLDTYGRDRRAGETFVAWSRRHTVGELQELLS
ncbi:MAG TPA: NirA family protein [Opitutaceae bacterium]|jgi:ferredoxin-nitrite reductase